MDALAEQLSLRMAMVTALHHLFNKMHAEQVVTALGQFRFRPIWTSLHNNFPSFFSLSLWCFFVEFWWCFEGRAALGPPGLHTTTRELQTCTFQGPCVSNTTKIPRKDPKEREERKKENCGGKREKKNAPTLRGPTLLGSTYGPTFCCPTSRGPNIRAPTFFKVWATTLRGLHPPPTRSPKAALA